MKLVQVVKSLALAGAIMVAPSMASASTLISQEVPGSWFGSNGSTWANITSPIGVSTVAGGFALKGDFNNDTIQEPFTAWCLDILTYITAPSFYNIVAAPFASNNIVSRIPNIEKLFETSFSTLDLTDDGQSAGFQLALWELTYETSSTFDVGVGNFKATSSSAAITYANQFLSGLTGPVVQDFNLSFLESVGHVSQNLVTARPAPIDILPPVPLPGAGLLLLGALGGLGMLGRRKRS